MASKKNPGKGKTQGPASDGAKKARTPKKAPVKPVEADVAKNQAIMEEMALPPQDASHGPLPEAIPAQESAEILARADPVVPEAEVARELAGEDGNKKPAEDKAPDKRAVTKAKGPRMPDGISQRPLFTGNPYLPRIATVQEIIEETHNIRTLRVAFDEPQAMAEFVFEPGQVAQLSVFGAGEATFVINSPPSQKDYLQFSVMRTGEVTDAIHRLSPGDKIGVRAPLGNYFPYADWKGKNVFFVGGGIGMAPIRTIMLYLLENKADYGKISLLYGARSPKDMAYGYELDAWKHNPDLDCTLCIDNPSEDWGDRVGLIPAVLEDLRPKPDNTVAVLCGPPIMIKFTLQALQKLGFEPENIVTTLEKRMKCGIGICGRCNIGDRYVCVDGPVFTLKELDGLPPDL